MVNTNIITNTYSDKAIVTLIGNYIKQQRLKQNTTQAKVAKAAGVNRWTLGQIENGEPISLLSLIQILRALDLLDILNVFQVKQEISPIALAKLEKQQRQRASTTRSTKSKPDSEW